MYIFISSMAMKIITLQKIQQERIFLYTWTTVSIMEIKCILYQGQGPKLLFTLNYVVSMYSSVIQWQIIMTVST